MFVTILGMAVGNLLMASADIVGGLRKPPPERIHLSWIILLLIITLNLFWETTAILDVEAWSFLDFLYMICGPMVLLFAASVIIAPAENPNADGQEHYFGMSGRLFTMLAISRSYRLHLICNGIAWVGYVAILFIQINE